MKHLQLRKKISVSELVKKLTKKSQKGEKITCCEKCKAPQLEQECIFCSPENIQQKITSGYWDKERKNIESLARKHFKHSKLVKNEISEFLENKGKIYKLDYDFETSVIKEQQGWVIFWSAKCCHGLVERGFELKTWLKLIRVLKTQKNEIVLQAHNGIKFDFTFWWSELVKEHLLSKSRENKLQKQYEKTEEEILKVSLVKEIKKEKKNQLKIWGNRAMVSWRNLVHLDTLQIFPLALENFPCKEEEKKTKEEGKQLFRNEEYLKGKFNEEWYKKLVIYCENDVNIQKQARDNLDRELRATIEKITKKPLPKRNFIYKKGTLASLGMYFFRQITPKDEFNHYFPNFSEEQFDDRREFVQKSFKGGIVDSWNEQKLSKDILSSVLDKVSMYPHIMKNYPMPSGIGRWVNAILQNELDQLKDTGFYQVEISWMKLNKGLSEIPLLYFYGNKGIKVGYEFVKNKVEWFSGAEWKFLNKYYFGEWRIIRGIEFESVKGFFDKFVDHFFKIKSNAKNKFEETFAKLILNSLYGRFGLRKTTRDYELKCKGKSPKTGEAKFLHSHTKNYYQWELGEEKKIKSFSYVPVAAMISSYSRIELMKVIVANQKSVLYWDTDCIIIKGDQYNFPAGQELGIKLGRWKLKQTAYGWDCVAAKIYRLHELIIAKGYRKGTHKKINYYIDNDYLRDRTRFISDERWKRLERGVVIEEVWKMFPRPKDNEKRTLVNGVWQSVKGCPEVDVDRFAWR